jgi:threonylcarbamoyladenosine tRNA methylthiotransferase MtaB
MAAARTRAFLKIQDGCDSFCSYCIVPYSRGRSRSLPLDQVHAQVDRFRDAGHQEIVLSGIHLGQWGKDLQPARTLLDLLVSLQGKAPPRVRLSSLETLEWDAGLIEHLARWDWICPHFHIPLQSGDAEILERMHRGYTPQMFAQLVRKLHRTFPQAALGSDVMVGFPGETQRHFRNTLELIEELPLTYLHVFPYSPRPGTEAAKWPGRVTGREIDQRAQALRELGARKRQEFQRRFLGRRLEILVEGEMNGQPGWLHGTTANYLKVAFEARGPIAPGTLAWVTVRRLSPSGLFGEMCAIPR